MVFKTRVKRFEFITNTILIALMGVAAGVLLLCAYGSTCVQFGPSFSPAYWMHIWMDPPGRWINGPFWWFPDFIVAYSITYFASWAIAFVWGFVIYSWLKQKSFAYMAALITSAAGFLAQAIPGLISDTKGFSIPFDGIGSPHWGGAMANLLVLIVLIIGLIPFGKNPIRNTVKSYTTSENKWGGTRAVQLMLMSTFLFWLAAVSFLGSTFMADAHTIDGVNVWQTVGYQFVIGGIIAAGGGTMFASGLILHIMRQPASIAKPL